MSKRMLVGEEVLDSERWQLHGSGPLMYQRYLVPAIISLWATDLLDGALPRAGERVLDLACGTGVVARLAAERMRSGRVVGVDVNAGMLAVARSVPACASPVIEWLEGSALALPLPSVSFDLILCQLGLQFFPDRPTPLHEMWRVLVPHGRVAVSVYSSIENTPATYALANALDRHLGLGASRTKRSEHDMSNPDELRELVGSAGFRHVRLETVTQIIRFPSAGEYVRLQLLATPLAVLAKEMDMKQRDAIVAAVTADLSKFLQIQSGGAELTYPQEAYSASSRSPSVSCPDCTVASSPRGVGLGSWNFRRPPNPGPLYPSIPDAVAAAARQVAVCHELT